MSAKHEPSSDFDHHSSEFAADPFTIAADLRGKCPVSWTEAHGGYWVVANHALVAEGFKDYERFSSASGATIPDLSLGNTHIPVTVDPPEFFGYRQMLTPRFSKGSLAGLEPTIREFVRQLVDDMARRGSWDFVHDLAEQVPGMTVLTMLGMSPDRRKEFTERMERGIDNAGTDDAALLAQIADDRQWLLAQVMHEIELRRSHPTADVMSYLVNEPMNGRLLTDREIIDIVMVLFVAGFHTTASALSACLMHLDKDRESRERLRQDPSLILPAIEEVIRVYSPATGMARTLKHDTDFGGVHMQAGEKVLLLILGANRDESTFANPSEIDLANDSRSSLAWGWGIHRCLGIHLARLMLKIEIETVLELVGDYEIDHDGVRLAPDIAVSYLYTSIPAHSPSALAASNGSEASAAR